MKFWTRSDRIITKTLTLLNDLSVGYSSVRKLMKLDCIHFLLANHTVTKFLSPKNFLSFSSDLCFFFLIKSDNFPFLGFGNQQVIKQMKCRTTFYTALGRLLNLDFTDDDDTFDRFIRPLSSKIQVMWPTVISMNRKYLQLLN